MKRWINYAVFNLAASAAVGAMLAGSAQAAPKITPPVKIVLPADLRMDSIEATPFGGLLAGSWHVKATLRNYVSKYPGGGTLIISRTSGGTIPTEPGSTFGPTVPDGGTIIAQKAVPALAVGQTLTVEGVTKGRAIFVANVQAPYADPDANQPPFPELPHTNNSKSVNTLTPRNFWLDSGWLETYLEGLTSQIKLRLDSNDAVGKLGTEYESHSKTAQVASPLGLKWDVRDINYHDTLEIAGTNSLVLLMRFETDAAELAGAILPAANANPIEVKVQMPLAFNQGQQFFLCSDQPQIVVEAPLSGLPGSWTGVQSDFNSRLADAVRDLFSHPKVQERLEYELNHQIREQMLKGYGRIVGVDFNGSMKIHAEIGG
jgi:hypothetical protein